MRYLALKNFTAAEGPAHEHAHVKAGEVHEIPEEYADEHLHPIGADEDPADHPHALVQETDKPLTLQAKKEEKAKKKEAKAKEKEEKGKKKSEKDSDEKDGKGKEGK